MRTCLCLLTFNEIQGCKEQIQELLTAEFDELICIDGGSTDGTIEYLRSKNIRVCKQPIPSLNAAYHHAYHVSQADFIVFFHPKGTISPKELTRFKNLIEQKNELIIASRNIKCATNEEDDLLLKPRKWFVQILGILVAILWKKEGAFISDILHGFRGISRRAFYEINPLPKGSTIDLEIMIGSYKHKLKRIEFPSKEVKRQYGETHFKSWSTGYKLIKHLCKELF